ncbi:MAG: OsmC family protein [Saprospiraceae bacterium]
MKIEIQRLDDAYHLRATNEDGNSVETDGAVSIGGSNKGMRPMQMLLSSLGSCSSIDVIQFLKKQRQPLEDIRVTITGEREPDKVPSLFTDVHVHYELFGNLDEDKVAKAVSLSMDKYCSVARILEKTAKITWDFVIHKEALSNS